MIRRGSGEGQEGAGMIIIAGLVGGAAWGAVTARRRGGNRLDVAQYAAVGGIVGGVLGLIASIVIGRIL
jgi:hypothetical protein